MALCMEAFTDTLPIVCNGFNTQLHVLLQYFTLGWDNKTINIIYFTYMYNNITQPL